MNYELDARSATIKVRHMESDMQTLNKMKSQMLKAQRDTG
jgi:hypothetical protein